MTMPKPISLRDALNIARDIVRANPIFGQKAEVKQNGASLFVDFEQAWGISAKLHVTIDFVGGPEGQGRPRVEVSWPSTNHSVSAAQACVALFSQVTNLGALIQATLDLEDITFSDLEQNPV